MAGRVCYVNSVITASFIHSMKVYLWPVSLLMKVKKVMRNFICSGSHLTKDKATMNWAKVCSPYKEEAFNVKSLKVLNMSLLMHFFWKISTSLDDGNQLVKSRLMKRNGVIRAVVSSFIRPGFNCSWPMINSRWLCGYPSAVSFWYDNWLGYTIADRVGIPFTHIKYFPFTCF